ncbi:hypothetical protein [Staphylococcus argenteus]|uniref:hypothetical protein n=1 Tax=Staphylococcus argenteus TaxID=985002 RepID=UPI00066D3B41|nr:hypothetical protein [Staphylococcus argenteus]MCO5362147.1 hypothetical protein [Staphylococcus argenteus]HAR3267747.1 hypothetical protein [Staphylococcus aureus]HCV7922353.1 hypothetical protein [Staphylococcus aureus]HCV9423046.1 hypothetical protein [Staphylococcus aureus]
MKAVPRIYDKKNAEWVELITKPIAEEVIKIMKDDWLSHKGIIDCWLLKYTNEDDPSLPEPIYVAIFVDSESVKNYEKDTLEHYFKDYILGLPNKKGFKLNEMINHFKNELLFELPQQFKLSVDLALENNQLNFPELDNITNNVDVVYTLANEQKGEITARYIYNGHAIPEKQYKFKAN